MSFQNIKKVFTQLMAPIVQVLYKQHAFSFGQHYNKPLEHVCDGGPKKVEPTINVAFTCSVSIKTFNGILLYQRATCSRPTYDSFEKIT